MLLSFLALKAQRNRDKYHYYTQWAGQIVSWMKPRESLLNIP